MLLCNWKHKELSVTFIIKLHVHHTYFFKCFIGFTFVVTFNLKQKLVCLIYGRDSNIDPNTESCNLIGLWMVGYFMFLLANQNRSIHVQLKDQCFTNFLRFKIKHCKFLVAFSYRLVLKWVSVHTFKTITRNICRQHISSFFVWSF